MTNVTDVVDGKLEPSGRAPLVAPLRQQGYWVVHAELCRRLSSLLAGVPSNRGEDIHASA